MAVPSRRAAPLILVLLFFACVLCSRAVLGAAGELSDAHKQALHCINLHNGNVVATVACMRGHLGGQASRECSACLSNATRLAELGDCVRSVCSALPTDATPEPRPTPTSTPPPPVATALPKPPTATPTPPPPPPPPPPPTLPPPSTEEAQPPLSSAPTTTTTTTTIPTATPLPSRDEPEPAPPKTAKDFNRLTVELKRITKEIKALQKQRPSAQPEQEAHTRAIADRLSRAQVLKRLIAQNRPLL